jgi:hypothetical protein
MIGTICWLLLLGASIGVELFARVRTTSTTTLARTGSLLATRISARVLLVLLWAFVGLHLFARYTLPGH